MTIMILKRKLKNAPYFLYNRLRYSYRWSLYHLTKWYGINTFFPQLTPTLWKMVGVHMGKNINIGKDVYLDCNYAEYITIEDDVWITSHSAIFAHRRVMDDYHKGGRYKNCPQKVRPVLIKKGACVGIGSLVTPGVTIGRGAVIGAGSVVVKDIPDWCLAAGSPCKVMRYLPEEGYYYNRETKQNEPIPGYKYKGDENERTTQGSN